MRDELIFRSTPLPIYATPNRPPPTSSPLPSTYATPPLLTSTERTPSTKPPSTERPVVHYAEPPSTPSSTSPSPLPTSSKLDVQTNFQILTKHPNVNPLRGNEREALEAVSTDTKQVGDTCYFHSICHMFGSIITMDDPITSTLLKTDKFFHDGESMRSSGQHIGTLIQRLIDLHDNIQMITHLELIDNPDIAFKDYVVVQWPLFIKNITESKIKDKIKEVPLNLYTLQSGIVEMLLPGRGHSVAFTYNSGEFTYHESNKEGHFRIGQGIPKTTRKGKVIPDPFSHANITMDGLYLLYKRNIDYASSRE